VWQLYASRGGDGIVTRVVVVVVMVMVSTGGPFAVILGTGHLLYCRSAPVGKVRAWSGRWMIEDVSLIESKEGPRRQPETLLASGGWQPAESPTTVPCHPSNRKVLLCYVAVRAVSKCAPVVGESAVGTGGTAEPVPTTTYVGARLRSAIWQSVAF
jgi:hypothetical protein